jgi:hypothetical protein
LSNPDITYIRNAERDTKLHQELRDKNKIVFMSFHLFYYGTNAPWIQRIYARAEGRDAKLLLMSSCFAKLLEANFSCFAK